MSVQLSTRQTSPDGSIYGAAPRGLFRAIGDDQDAGAGSGRADDLEPPERVIVGEQAFTGAGDHRVDHQDQLVEQVVAQQRLDERGAAADADVAAVLLLE